MVAGGRGEEGGDGLEEVYGQWGRDLDFVEYPKGTNNARSSGSARAGVSERDYQSALDKENGVMFTERKRRAR